MKFKDWVEKRELLEVGTCTGSVASFARPIFGGNMVQRMFPPLIASDDEEKHKKKKKHKKKD